MTKPATKGLAALELVTEAAKLFDDDINPNIGTSGHKQQGLVSIETNPSGKINCALALLPDLALGGDKSF